jgi:hypothetical protein
MTEDRISEEELAQIKEAQSKMELHKLQAREAVALSRVMELEYQNVVLRVYNKHQVLDGTDVVLNTGEIKRGRDKAVALQEVKTDE